MRIRMLAAAVVTAGALMATLTGAASADTPTPAPAPLPKEGVVLIQCEGGGHVTLTTRRLTDAEREKLEKEGAALAVPAIPAVPAVPPGKAGEAGESKRPEVGELRVDEFRRAEAGGATIADDILTARPDSAPPAPPEGVTPPRAVRIIAASPRPEGAPKPGEAATLSTAVSAPDGTAVTEVKVTGKQSEGDVPAVTCVSKATEE
ncbi:hypothetical protein [Streptosporangium sp. NPDC002721]|uniref:hypothetical protein n=1 Tax=Streptosporangium sp. NPDC002721 TaxID=3366188 RepID=UPI0036B1F6ED